MFEILTAVVFIWLMISCVRLALRLTWGAAKIAAGILMVLSLPAMILCFALAGGLILLLPLGLILIAAVILRACISG